MYTLGYFLFRSQIFIGCMISRLRFFSIFKSWTVPVIVTQALCRNQCVRTETWLSIEHRSRRPIKSICSRLKAKEARIRGNHWNWQACSFLGPYNYHTRSEHNIDELGVPWSIALNLTYLDTVTPYNIERWTSLFLLTNVI